MEEKGPFSRVDRAYVFFLRMEEECCSFYLEELLRATKYQLSTASIYLSKKWSSFVFTTEDGKYRCDGISAISLEEFRDLHKQKRTPGKVAILSSHWTEEEKQEARDFLEDIRDQLQDQTPALQGFFLTLYFTGKKYLTRLEQRKRRHFSPHQPPLF